MPGFFDCRPGEIGESMDYIKFLGTAGARMVLCRQLRSSGGIWLSLAGKNLLLDPGPGALIRSWGSSPPLDPADLDGIILSHRHLDHSGDLNAMVEAMAEGGYQPHGEIYAPGDVYSGEEPILLRYLRGYPDHLNVVETGSVFQLEGLTLTFPIRHIHPVPTYGVRINWGGKSLSYIADTRFFPELIPAYQADVVIMNMTFVEAFHGEKAYHLSAEEIGPLITGISPKQVILTHFGRRVLQSGPEKLAAKLSLETGIPVLAATDGMVYTME